MNTASPSPCLPLASKHWHLGINAHTGALSRVTHPDDAHGMSWVNDSTPYPSFLDAHGWGLGFLAMPGGNGPQRWQRATAVKVTQQVAHSHYTIAAIAITVTRRLRGSCLEESFTFHNRGTQPEPIWGIGLYAPFNDNYPDAATCVTQRANAHLWCGGHSAYACCLRMGGASPHLGLVLTEGYLGGYSIEGRGLMQGGSNTRGSIVFNAPGLTLQPGQTHRVAWTCFWHTGWDDFFAQARQIPAFVQVQAERYTYLTGQPPRLTASDPTAVIDPLPATAGEQTVKVRYGAGRETWLRLNAVDEIGALVRRRLNFIRERQQVNDPTSPYDGAFVCYDTETNAQLRHGYRGDFSEGRERVGMGVLLAQSLRHWPDAQVVAALQRYRVFVRTKLQRPDGAVAGEVGGDTHRLYNFPWVAQLHLELYHALGEPSALADCFDTLCAYYRQGGDHFYPIGLPIVDALAACRAAGRQAEAATLLAHFRRHGEQVVSNGLALPKHEVNYEQTIVSPAVLIALECHLVTGDAQYLDCAKTLLPALEAFSGRQPDHRLHEIAIRHWDGYWFGKREMWGDVFPHYWSATTGWAYYRYWQATGDEAYRQRARTILLNNLSSFRPDGSATCAYLYPDAVNGQPARFADPLANDQDWALVFLLQAAQLDPAFVRDCWQPTRET